MHCLTKCTTAAERIENTKATTTITEKSTRSHTETVHTVEWQWRECETERERERVRKRRENEEKHAKRQLNSGEQRHILGASAHWWGFVNAYLYVGSYFRLDEWLLLCTVRTRFGWFVKNHCIHNTGFHVRFFVVHKQVTRAIITGNQMQLYLLSMGIAFLCSSSFSRIRLA